MKIGSWGRSNGPIEAVLHAVVNAPGIEILPRFEQDRQRSLSCVGLIFTVFVGLIGLFVFLLASNNPVQLEAEMTIYVD